jgi:hypothetical protein
MSWPRWRTNEPWIRSSTLRQSCTRSTRKMLPCVGEEPVAARRVHRLLAELPGDPTPLVLVGKMARRRGCAAAAELDQVLGERRSSRRGLVCARPALLGTASQGGLGRYIPSALKSVHHRASAVVSPYRSTTVGSVLRRWADWGRHHRPLVEGGLDRRSSWRRSSVGRAPAGRRSGHPPRTTVSAGLHLPVTVRSAAGSSGNSGSIVGMRTLSRAGDEGRVRWLRGTAGHLLQAGAGTR